jgi:hypothetical protein
VSPRRPGRSRPDSSPGNAEWCTTAVRATESTVRASRWDRGTRPAGAVGPSEVVERVLTPTRPSVWRRATPDRTTAIQAVPQPGVVAVQVEALSQGLIYLSERPPDGSDEPIRRHGEGLSTQIGKLPQRFHRRLVTTGRTRPDKRKRPPLRTRWAIQDSNLGPLPHWHSAPTNDCGRSPDGHGSDRSRPSGLAWNQGRMLAGVASIRLPERLRLWRSQSSARRAHRLIL